MKLPFVSRKWYEDAVSGMETEIWDLRKQVKILKERERARMVCVSAIEQDAGDARRELEAMQAECAALRERVQLLGEDNRELRRRYDTARAELTRTTREVKTLRLMRTALEARVAAPCEVEAGT
jgi:chromosome segregation ATPase